MGEKKVDLIPVKLKIEVTIKKKKWNSLKKITKIKSQTFSCKPFKSQTPVSHIPFSTTGYFWAHISNKSPGTESPPLVLRFMKWPARRKRSHAHLSNKNTCKTPRGELPKIYRMVKTEKLSNLKTNVAPYIWDLYTMAHCIALHQGRLQGYRDTLVMIRYHLIIACQKFLPQLDKRITSFLKLSFGSRQLNHMQSS